VNNKSVIRDEARFRILRLLHENPSLTQRELGTMAGVSLGAVNYCLRALVDRGLVKVRNFSRNPNKIGYAYVLTPAGIAEKTVLTVRFLNKKLLEHRALKIEIEALSREFAGDGATRRKSSDAEVG
jgi:EPS-associated MarR family transcriptional regulator